MTFRDYFERNVVQYFDYSISESVKAVLVVLWYTWAQRWTFNNAKKNCCLTMWFYEMFLLWFSCQWQWLYISPKDDLLDDYSLKGVLTIYTVSKNVRPFIFAII